MSRISLSLAMCPLQVPWDPRSVSEHGSTPSARLPTPHKALTLARPQLSCPLSPSIACHLSQLVASPCNQAGKKPRIILDPSPCSDEKLQSVHRLYLCHLLTPLNFVPLSPSPPPPSPTVSGPLHRYLRCSWGLLTSFLPPVSPTWIQLSVVVKVTTFNMSF